MNKRKTGAAYERKAEEYLKDRGYRILERNYRCRYGEIDLVAQDGDYLVFVEVKYRRDNRLGEGECAVGYPKQRRISFTARWYLMERGISETMPCRFDVVALQGEKMTLIRDAFFCLG